MIYILIFFYLFNIEFKSFYLFIIETKNILYIFSHNLNMNININFENISKLIL